MTTSILTSETSILTEVTTTEQEDRLILTTSTFDKPAVIKGQRSATSNRVDGVQSFSPRAWSRGGNVD